jgi:hypothetical protein
MKLVQLTIGEAPVFINPSHVKSAKQQGSGTVLELLGDPKHVTVAERLDDAVSKLNTGLNAT